MATCSKKVADVDWLYPELLSKDGLVHILYQRYVQEPNLQDMDKEELLQLYYKYIIPLPQRQYRQNRRGREMTKKQIIMAKKRRIEAPSSDEPPSKKQTLSSESSRFLTSFSDPTKKGDRLKPPPSCIDPSRKVIKLGSGNKTTTSPPVSPAQDVSKLSKKIVKISMSPTETKCKSPENKTIKLINKHLSSSKDKSIAEENGDVEMEDVEKKEKSQESLPKQEVTPQKKIKLKRISWP